MIDPELVDLLAPAHGRTSCSDLNTSNGFGSNGTNVPPRCTRCALLELVHDPALLSLNRLMLQCHFERVPFQPGDTCPACGKVTAGPTFCGSCGGVL